MKKVVNISFSITYVMFSIGVAISSHYCLGRVSHQDFFSFDNHGCVCEDLMMDVDDCCNDKLAIVSIEDDQQVSSQLVSVIPKLAILFSFDIANSLIFDSGLGQLAFNNNFEYPPPKQQPLYLLNSNYIFYG